ncbi:hypothetical protein UA08_02506 [Talaromyces atroroseus]|uniref:Mannosyltransferase KTR4 n=1 Tax=Talaromyces atroroseus TaxID=1441469 RepID=A0A225B7F7_TALAT|nr:hypothetical protein UA08_02506 [Talaromyces atroroseus]OKL61867.1 hypothetical protein UA08_02506 [Talaromyces atroroseus]
MILKVPLRLVKNIVGCFFLVLLLFALYMRYDYDNWYRSSGDRALARMNFSIATTARTARKDATLIMLARNEELEGVLSSMRQLESSWNNKYHYPWIFFNNEPFTDEFKARTQEETNSECRYELIPKEHWDVPEWIDSELLETSMRRMKSQRIKYSARLGYHQMCRWNSGFFYRHPALEDYRYYWRVEPNVKFFCNLDYDPFQFLADNNKTYGFTINVYDDPLSITTLWPETMTFLDAHPNYLSADNSMSWLTDRTLRPEHTEAANGYSTCHFWSNFEIADMTFWRSPQYQEYFEHLDRAGGFFYERWGDAPVHSVALGLFEDNSRIHWFRDIGYQHPPFINCPDTPNCNSCQANIFTHSWSVINEDCRVNWFKQMCESRRKHSTNNNLTSEEEEICRQLYSIS